MLASASVVSIAACSENSLAPYQPEVSNVADNFALQATGVANVTATQSYTWANSGTRATINHSTTTQSGTTLLVIKDASGTTVYSKALSPSLNEPTVPVGVTGNWTLRLTLTNEDAFATHLAQTEEHVARLEQVFTEIEMSPKGKHCKGMKGLVAEGADLLKEHADPDVLDTGLISSAQHVEHYEMAGYGTSRPYAQLLGFPKQVELLQKALDEEQATDLLLTEIARNRLREVPRQMPDRSAAGVELR